VYIYPTNYPEGRLGAPFHGVYKILDNYHEWLVDAYPQEQRALYLSIYPFIHYKTVSPREKDKFPVRVMRVMQYTHVEAGAWPQSVTKRHTPSSQTYPC
jgi:hypothetical protein